MKPCKRCGEVPEEGLEECPKCEGTGDDGERQIAFCGLCLGRGQIKQFHCGCDLQPEEEE